MICIDPEGSACIAEDELGIHLEEWEGSDDRQEPPSISAVEDSLLFESKTTFASVLCSGVAPFLSCKPSDLDLSPEKEEFCLVLYRLLMLPGISLLHRGYRGQ